MSSKRTARITLPRVSILEYYTTRTSARSLFFFRSFALVEICIMFHFFFFGLFFPARSVSTKPIHNEK